MTHASSILWSLSVLFWLDCPWQIISSLVHLSNIVGIVCIYVVRKDCGTVCMIWNQKSSWKLEILCKCIKWSAPLLDLVHKWRPTFMIIHSTADATLPRGWNSVPVENIVKSKLAIALYPTTWGYVSYILNWMRQSQKAHSSRSRAHLAVSTERVHKWGHCSVNRVHLLLWPTMAVYYVIHVALIAWSRASNFLCIVVCHWTWLWPSDCLLREVQKGMPTV